MRNKDSDQVKPAEASVLPVMNIMFMLIPALLLAMEVASMGEIAIETPHGHSVRTSPEDSTEPLGLEVAVLSDGFRTTYHGHSAAEHGPDIPLGADGALDFVTLEAKARELKTAYPEEIKVTVTAENDVELHQLVGTMDALRGAECKQAGVASGASSECLFWRPVVQHM